MATQNAFVAIYENHVEAEKAVKELQQALKMNKLGMKMVIATLLVLLVPNPSLAYSRSENDQAASRLQRFLTPDEEFIMAFNSAKALPHLASARKDIVRNNIPGAQSEVGQALTLIDEMKSRFPVIRLEELIAAARIRLSYEEPKLALAYLELITPALANIQEPAASSEATEALERAKAFLKNSDKEAADHELAALEEVLNFKTAARPAGLVEKYLLAAEAQLDKSQPENADRSIEAAEDSLRFLAVKVDTPMFQAKQSLWQATLDYTAGRWSAAKADLGRASALLEQAVKTASTDSRVEIRSLDRDVHELIKKTAQDEQILGDSISGLWRRSESLADRAFDYQVAAWEKLQSAGTGSEDLIEAKLHVAYAEIDEFTSRDKQKSETELEKAESYIGQAIPQMSGKAKPELEKVEKELTLAKTEIRKDEPGQKERYAAIKDTLSSLIQ
jgi:YfdX protein